MAATPCFVHPELDSRVSEYYSYLENLTDGSLQEHQEAAEFYDLLVSRSPGSVLLACRIHFFLWSYVPPVIFLLGSLGNILGFLVLRHPSTRHVSAFVYLATRSVIDQLVLIIGLLRHWIDYLLNTHLEDQSAVLCKLAQTLGTASSYLSVWLTVALTAERGVVVSRPLHASRLVSPSKARRLILLLGVACTLASLHFLETVGLVEWSSASSPVDMSAQDTQTSEPDVNGSGATMLVDLSSGAFGPVGHAETVNQDPFVNRTHETGLGQKRTRQQGLPIVRCDFKAMYSDHLHQAWLFFDAVIYCFLPFCIITGLNILILYHVHSARVSIFRLRGASGQLCNRMTQHLHSACSGSSISGNHCAELAVEPAVMYAKLKMPGISPAQTRAEMSKPLASGKEPTTRSAFARPKSGRRGDRREDYLSEAETTLKWSKSGWLRSGSRSGPREPPRLVAGSSQLFGWQKRMCCCVSCKAQSVDNKRSGSGQMSPEPDERVALFGNLHRAGSCNSSGAMLLRPTGCGGGNLGGESARQLTVMLLVVSFAFLITTTPIVLTKFIALVNYQQSINSGPGATAAGVKGSRQRGLLKLSDSVAELLMYVNHAINFYLFCATGKRFRRRLFSLLARLPWCGRAFGRLAGLAVDVLPTDAQQRNCPSTAAAGADSLATLAPVATTLPVARAWHHRHLPSRLRLRVQFQPPQYESDVSEMAVDKQRERECPCDPVVPPADSHYLIQDLYCRPLPQQPAKRTDFLFRWQHRHRLRRQRRQQHQTGSGLMLHQHLPLRTLCIFTTAVTVAPTIRLRTHNVKLV